MVQQLLLPTAAHAPLLGEDHTRLIPPFKHPRCVYTPPNLPSVDEYRVFVSLGTTMEMIMRVFCDGCRTLPSRSCTLWERAAWERDWKTPSSLPQI